MASWESGHWLSLAVTAAMVCVACLGEGDHPAHFDQCFDDEQRECECDAGGEGHQICRGSQWLACECETGAGGVAGAGGERATTGGRDRSTGGADRGTGGDGGVNAGGGGSSTGGAEPSTGGAEPSTGGAEPSTGGAEPATGGSNLAGGGAGAGGEAGRAGTGGSTASGGIGGAGGGSGTGGTVTPAPEEVPHPVYFYAERMEEADQMRYCDLFTGEAVGDSADNYSIPVARFDPISGEIWSRYGGTGIVHTLSDHPDTCTGATDFAFHPATGALATKCGDWYDETGASTPAPARYRDLEGRFWFDGVLYDATGAVVELDVVAPDFIAVHSRPTGGFWGLALASGVVTRYSITPAGEVILDGSTSDSAGVTLYSPGAALDDLGGMYLQGAPGGNVSRGAVVRVRSDFAATEIVHGDGQPGGCTNADYWGRILSTP